ncbi:hypothetical protein DFO45_0839 [Azorhizobium sp. AG788]|uniref:hypothetical protein n=1 Tax=Azorhizobium sp. AG788 TaxID=2183897 RepID=UPI00105EB920|nr:hypothetical protein [Azorhizobium sp. AG788]TDT99134.1 hypothetical protein DFO45_0839 [Azorhizobium sp. AG788]
MDENQIISLAISEYRSDAEKSEPGISETALIRACVESLNDDLNRKFEYILNNAKDYKIGSKRDIRIEYWCKLEVWSAEEAAFLAIGFDPDDAKLIDRCSDEEKAIFRDVERAVRRFVDGGNTPFPPDIIYHLKQFGFEFSKEIRSNIRLNERRKARFERKYRRLRKSQIDNAKHLDSLLKLILAFCVIPHEYTQGARTPAVQKIIDTARDHYVHIDKKTVKSILDAAVSRSKFLIRNNKS